jgi:hypothetical protein
MSKNKIKIVIYFSTLFITGSLLAFFSGCTPVGIPPGITWEGRIAVSGAYMRAQKRTKTIPDSVPGSECSSCGGTGKVGDNVVSVICQACDGTGVTQEETIKHSEIKITLVPGVEETNQQKSDVKKSVLVPKYYCKDGKCTIR